MSARTSRQHRHCIGIVIDRVAAVLPRPSQLVSVAAAFRTMPLYQKRARKSADKDAQRVTDGIALLQQSAVDSEVQFLAEHFRSEPDLAFRVGALVRSGNFFQLLSQDTTVADEPKKSEENKQFRATVKQIKHLIGQMTPTALKILSLLEPTLLGHLAGVTKKDLAGMADMPGSAGDMLCFALNVAPESDLCLNIFPQCQTIRIFIDACVERYFSMGSRLKADNLNQISGYYKIDYDRKKVICIFWEHPVDLPMKQSLPEAIDATDVSISGRFQHDAKLHIHLKTPKFEATIDLKGMFEDIGATFPPLDAPWVLPKFAEEQRVLAASAASVVSSAASTASPAKPKQRAEFVASASPSGALSEAVRKRLAGAGGAKRGST